MGVIQSIYVALLRTFLSKSENIVFLALPYSETFAPSSIM